MSLAMFFFGWSCNRAIELLSIAAAVAEATSPA
jgi:hypothetical protein